MICQNCQKENDLNSSFCKFCGSKILNYQSETISLVKDEVAASIFLPPPINHINPLAQFNTFYGIALVICLIIGFVNGYIVSGLVPFLLAALIIFFVRKMYSVVKLAKLRSVKHQISTYVPETKIIDYLNRTFHHPDVELDFTSDIRFIYQKKIIIIV